MNTINLKGKYTLEHWRGGVLIHKEEVNNAVVNQGRNFLLDVMFNGTAAVAAADWHIGLIDNAGFSALAAGDTYQQINGTNGWDEFTDYEDVANSNSALTRPLWPADAASSQTVTNSSPADFEITASGTVRGGFLAGGAEADTKDDVTAGNILFGHALFSSPRSVVDGDLLRITYTVTA